ncbi:hypothetical protein GIB67_012814 [Kingdonia uniflora]|uniref:Uncharacterized protein n=1 Tax=Kingdonia uniflora TaxID=39325 RepID=A0A7J7NFH8_9MAGN|nr:hypothetical protein GIB67_012814 [Kingdonia uniflora]
MSETLIRSNSDSKVICETMIGPNPSDPQPNPPDFPPESFLVSIEDEFEWFDQNAYYDRTESTKGISNSDSIPNSSTNLNPNLGSNQKFSKASMIGLPKPQKSNFVVGLRRKKASNARFFPKRSQSTVSVGDPGSPKVSCIGRVRSKKERRRRLKNSQRKTESNKEPGSGEPRRKTGFWSSFKDAFLLGCRKNLAVDVENPTVESTPPRKVAFHKRNLGFKPDMGTGTSGGMSEPPPGLGGLNKFASGRRSKSWGGGEIGIEVV